MRLYQWQKNLKKQHQWHLEKARNLRSGKEPCTNPEHWAKYHRGEAIKLARIINQWERQS